MLYTIIWVCFHAYNSCIFCYYWTLLSLFFFFFFSSRRRHTRLTCDWSSDVCSSDLHRHGRAPIRGGEGVAELGELCRATDEGCVVSARVLLARGDAGRALHPRSEERRVGKECRSRWSPYP